LSETITMNLELAHTVLPSAKENELLGILSNWERGTTKRDLELCAATLLATREVLTKAGKL